MAVTELTQKGKIEINLKNFFNDKLCADDATISKLKTEFEEGIDWAGYNYYNITDINNLWDNTLYIALDLVNNDVEAWQDSNDGIEIDTIVSGDVSKEDVIKEVKEIIDSFLSDTYSVSEDNIEIEVDELEEKSELETRAEEMWEEEAEYDREDTERMWG